MCFPGAQFIPMAAQGVMQGLSSMSDARYQAAVARHDGKQARLAAGIKAQQIARKGAQELAAMRRAMLGTGNVSALDFITDETTNVGQDIAWAKYGGEVSQAEAEARAKRAKQLGWQGVVGEAVGVGTKLLTQFSSSGFVNPPVASYADYGQLWRYGTLQAGAGGRVGGGL
jgi:hypothetical protein